VENLRRKHPPAFKAKVALEAIKKQKTSAQAGQSVSGHPKSDTELEGYGHQGIH